MFQLEALTLEVIKVLKPIVRSISAHDRNLADQLKRAATSIALNVSESSYTKGGNRKAQLHVAAGSANESRAALRVACRGSAVQPPVPRARGGGSEREPPLARSPDGVSPSTGGH